MSKLLYVCTECGSPDVLFDAWAEWDEKTQQMVLHSSFDATHCTVCEGACKVEEINLDDDGKTNKGRANLEDLGF